MIREEAGCHVSLQKNFI